MKTIHIDISSRSSVSQAISELQNVKKEWQRKADLCSETIAAVLAEEINKNLDEIKETDDLINVKTHSKVYSPNGITATAIGNRVEIYGSEVAFVEFGAGITHNQGTNNPLSDKVHFDTAIGSYGKGQGNKPYWFIYHNVISRGTPAGMPIQKAIETVEPMIPTLVRQVFV